MIIGGKTFELKDHTYIMGILNVTPDSFSDGGSFLGEDAALFHVQKMVEEGAHIIDVGGESTRPGAVLVSAEEEMARVIPVIRKIKAEFNIPISLDTFKPETALEGIRAGVDLINDVKGLKINEGMGRVISQNNIPCCLMHNREIKKDEALSEYFSDDLKAMLALADEEGIERENLILDPGIGFNKTTEENLWILKNLTIFSEFNVPWLLGASRKSVIGNTLKLPTDERLEGTLALTALAAMNGAAFVRVHDIKENKRVVDMLEAVKNA